jgi:hypothetical protein
MKHAQLAVRTNKGFRAGCAVVVPSAAQLSLVRENAMKTRLYLALMIAALGSGCHTLSATRADVAAAEADVRKNAFSLLYELLNQERHVSKLLIIKRESRPLNRLIKEIAETCADGADHLKDLAARDVSLVLDATGLPPGERATREAIADTKKKQLLGKSGEEFERALLLTQLEALNYGAHLAQVIAAKDPDQTRAAYLSGLSQNMTALRTRAMDLLFKTSP